MKYVILVAAWVLGFAVRVYPCVVERILTVPEATRSAKAIFVGRVAAMTDQLDGSPDPNSYARRVVLDVRDVWKGPQRPQLVVWTLPGTGACGTPFVKGELFIVFANEGEHNTLVTDIMWPSARLTTERPIPPSLGRPTWHNRRWQDSPAISPSFSVPVPGGTTRRRAPTVPAGAYVTAASLNAASRGVERDVRSEPPAGRQLPAGLSAIARSANFTASSLPL